MSDPVSALPDAVAEGFATIREMGVQGMITLRGDLGAPAMSDALKALGLAVPKQRAILSEGAHSVAWMSPDELLILCPHDTAQEMTQHLTEALKGQHALAVNVSDARAMFRIEGPLARDVLAKLAPVDLSPERFKQGEIRRTRLAQVPAAFFLRDAQTIELVCFRSVARYVFDLLEMSARDGSEPGLY